MNKYELLLILPGTLDEKEAEKKSQEIVEVVKQYGQDAVLTVLGKNRLAYPVKQIRYGYFYTVTFSAENTQVKPLQDKLNLMREVLRAMITHFNTELSALQKQAYSSEANGAVAMMEKVMAQEETEPVQSERMNKPTAPVPAPEVKPEAAPGAPAKDEKKLDMAEITKKLDEIMSGDNIIPGV
jgi:small subunit ribosomal protein S6